MRPSLSYWQDAWIRLKANRRAFASLIIVILLIAFALLGPLVWKVDPSDNDNQTSRPPGADRTAIVVNEYRKWDGVTREEPDVDGMLPSTLAVVGMPSTQYVRLTWDRPRDASGYRVYRNIVDPEPDGALGSTLGDVLNSATVSFEDKSPKLRTYYYSVVGIDETGRQGHHYQTIKVSVKQVITAKEAVAKGLVESKSDVALGDTVLLRLHPLGTDSSGRDILARLMHGAGVSLFIGIVPPFVFVAVGIIYGGIAGFTGGRTDQYLMRFADFVVALPYLLFMILFRVLFKVESGDSGIFPMIVAMVLLSWPAAARIVRGQILQLREQGYVEASRLLGARTSYLILRHMIPNTMGVILVTLTFAVPSAIFTEAFLSFIGMGVAPPAASWGSMCNDGLATMRSTPHELLAPAILISITVLAFNLLGDGLRDALDARMRAAE